MVRSRRKENQIRQVPEFWLFPFLAKAKRRLSQVEYFKNKKG